MTYGLPWWYIAVTEAAWCGFRLWLRVLRVVDRAAR